MTIKKRGSLIFPTLFLLASCNTHVGVKHPQNGVPSRSDEQIRAPSVNRVGDCGFQTWFEYFNVQLSRSASSNAYWFITNHKAVDADGAPNAYHPADIGHPCGRSGYGLDCPAHAGYPDSGWWNNALAPDPVDPSKAYVQNDGDYEGYFVSMTSLFDSELDVLNTDRYVNASEVPYLVFPRSFYRTTGTGKLGDVGFAFNVQSGKSTPFIVADIGPDKPLGEGSIKLFENLGGSNVNPRNGVGLPGGDIVFVVFPYSSDKRRSAWPISNREIHQQTQVLLSKLGGLDAILSCMQPTP